MFGNPCTGISLFKERGIPVVEDCAQSVGAELSDCKVGTLGDLSIFSFYATKVITCGEGGMVASNRPELTATIADLCDYDNRDDYRPRYNYKMTDFQAAMGLVQLARLPGFIQRRREIAQRYDTGLQDLPLRRPETQSDQQPIYFRYVVQLANPESLQNHLRDHEISAARPVFKPYQLLIGNNDCPASLRLWHESLSLPIYPLLQNEEVDQVIAIIRNYYQKKLHHFKNGSEKTLKKCQVNSGVTVPSRCNRLRTRQLS
jgi:dTDP-4-amino-4,6-dideoxygalactose transaminase